MQDSLAFILGVLDRSSPAFVAAEDFAGPHAAALRLWQRLGLLANAGEPHPVPSCPECREGIPVLLGDCTLCGTCQSPIGPEQLQRWRFDHDAFMSWLARALQLDGLPRSVDESLWQLGTLVSEGLPVECFLRRSLSISDRGRRRLLAFRSALLLSFLPGGDGLDGFTGPRLSVLEVLRQDAESLSVPNPPHFLHQRSGRVRFEAGSGTLWAGDVRLGEVSVGSKEYHLLAYLAEHLDTFVPYADLKHEVLRRSGSTDTTEEATFCHKLKSRLKKAVPAIGRLVVKTNKGDGYRLRSNADWRINLRTP
jgi:DNA-binding winged helix-turn-helix (wHTH) protein